MASVDIFWHGKCYTEKTTVVLRVIQLATMVGGSGAIVVGMENASFLVELQIIANMNIKIIGGTFLRWMEGEQVVRFYVMQQRSG